MGKARRPLSITCAGLGCLVTVLFMMPGLFPSQERLMIAIVSTTTVLSGLSAWLESGAGGFFSGSGDFVASSLMRYGKRETVQPPAGEGISEQELMALIRNAMETSRVPALEASQFEAIVKKLVLALEGRREPDPAEGPAVQHALPCGEAAGWHDEKGLVDYQTGARSRRCFDLSLASEIANAKKTGSPLTVLLVDVGQLNAVRSRHGGVAADELLKWVAVRLATTVRGRDVVARFGSQEFAIVLPCTSSTQAQNVIENILQTLDKDRWVPIGPSEARYRITPVIGIATFNDGESSTMLIKRAEAELHLARLSAKAG